MSNKGKPQTIVLDSVAWLGRRISWRKNKPLDKTYAEAYLSKPTKKELVAKVAYTTKTTKKECVIRGTWDRFAILNKQGNYSYDNTMQVQDRNYNNGWATLLKHDPSMDAPWTDQSTPKDSTNNLGYAVPIIKDVILDSTWGHSDTQDQNVTIGYIEGIPTDLQKRIIWARRYVPQRCYEVVVSHTKATLDFNLNQSTEGYIREDNKVILSIGGSDETVIKCSPKEEGGNKDAYIDYPDPIFYPKDEKDPLETKQVYYIMNQVSVSIGGTELHINNLSLSIDIGSWAWRFSATLVDQTQFILVNPAHLDDPAEVVISINGYVWKILVNSFNRTRQFVGEVAQISGSSLSLELAPPIFEKRTLIESTTLTGVQLADQELFGLGWSLSWENPISGWNVESNIWSYNDKTPVEVISDIASAVGGFVSPHKSEKELRVKPKYKQHYWAMDNITPDVVIASAMADSESVTWRPQPAYNGVSIGGISSGVIVKGNITGTDGEPQAASQTHKLITTVGAGQEACRNVLASYGNKKDYSYSLPLYAYPANPQLSECGDIIEVKDEAGGSWMGWVKSISVTVSIINRAIKVRQTVKIERHIQ
jgi:hypothetical protein